MIAVVGEALIDLITGPGGGVRAVPGGGPFNVARTISRLGQESAFLGRFSADPFGRLLRTSLDRDGVTALLHEAVEAPSTLAVADISRAGAVRYRFYLAGTSAAALDYPEAAAALAVAGASALHVGSLGLVMEPAGTTVEQLVAEQDRRVLVMLDPNWRPGAITDVHAYRERVSRVLSRADVLKVSREDLGYLLPGTRSDHAAASLLVRGPALVLVTDGPRPARAFLPGSQIEVPVPPAEVVDTIGAGDAFGGAFLAWWLGNKLGRPDLERADMVREALRAAVGVAVLTCTRAGAEPPRAEDLAGHPGWRWLTEPGQA